MTLTKESTLEIVQRLAARDIQERRDPKNRYRMVCPVCNYQSRTGGPTTFSIQADGNQWYCFACGNGGGPREMLAHLTGTEAITPRPLRTAPITPREAKPATTLEGATLKDLCESKGLDPDWCRDFLGWRDGWWYKTPAVEIPYYTEPGIVGTTRFRVGLNGQDRFRAKGSQMLYGAWDWSRIKDIGWVVVVEGETDFATLHQHDYPAIGVPGASAWKPGYAALFEGLTVYLWKEPDTGGETLLSKLAASIPNLLIINAPSDAKDPNELFQKDPESFPSRFDELLAQALPMPIPDRFEGMSSLEWLYSEEATRFRGWYASYKDRLEQQKARFVKSLPENTPPERIRKTNIECCYSSYRAMKCLNLGETFLKRYRCGEPVCPLCSIWLLDKFFTHKGADGVTKQELLETHLKDASVYLVDLGSWRPPPDKEEAIKEIRKLEKSIVGINTRFTDNYGDSHNVARNHIRGVRVKTEGGTFNYQVVLLADHERGAADLLADHFSQETGIKARVTEVNCHGTHDAIEKFVNLMALRCDWDTPENYELWREATKGSRHIQGKGLFYKVSGGKKSSKKERQPEECPVCGNCSPVEEGRYYSVVSTPTERVTSEFTGKVYLVRKDLESG